MGGSRFIVLAVAAAALSGCGAGQRGSMPDGTAVQTLPPAANGAAPAPPADAGPAERVAHAYAVAARDWSAETLMARWRRQVALSTGTLRRTLLAAPPRAADLDRLRFDDASARATVERVVVDHATARRVRLVVRVRERIEAAGAITEQVTDNLVEVTRRDARWRVVAFGPAP